MENMATLARYEKVEILILGLIVPICILIWTVALLSEGKSVFPGRSQLVYFYGAQSYLISALWFGVSFGFISRFFLRHTILKKQKNKLTASYWLSVFLIIIGLASSIWVTING